MSKNQLFRITLLCISILLGGLFLPGQAFSQQTESDTGVNTVYLPIVNIPPIKTVFGAEMNPLNDSQGFHKMATADISWVRRNAILWSDVEPIQGSYDWSALESLEADFLRARANDMEVIAIIRGVPEWARVAPYNYACGLIDPADLPAFGDFMYAVVQRYSGYPYYVNYWEIWNEPDVSPESVSTGNSPFGCLADQTDTTYYGGQTYTSILQATYPRIKQANSNAQVLVGGLLLACNPALEPEACYQSRYLEGILASGGANYFDGVSFHAYDYFSIGQNDYQTGIYGSPGWSSGGSYSNLLGDLKPVLVPKTQYIKSLFTLYNVQGKYLINTETALLCGGISDPSGGPGCEATPDSAYEKLKAAYMPQTYAAAIAEGLIANIWYSPTGWRNSGLFFSDFTHRPAFDALLLARDTLKNATFVREINEYAANKIFGYEFKLQNETIWLLWTLDGKTHTLTLPQTPTTVFDELGAPIALSGNLLTVEGLKTYYVDWSP